MSVTGNYKIEIKSAFGDMETVLILNADGESFTAQAEAMGMKIEILDGRVDGDSFVGSSEIKSPMGKMDMELSGTVNGDVITGKLASKMMTTEFTGVRVADGIGNEEYFETREYDGREFSVIMTKAIPPASTEGVVSHLEQGVNLVDDIVIEYDVPVTMRDGVTIYADVYRPKGEANVPAIVAWSPYGKRTGGAQATSGVPAGTLSENTKLEGPDPEFWCRQGFAVVNPDARGAGRSEGDVQYWTKQEARDSADLIDFIGAQDWCNGRVGMAGNSWLAISQWAAAAERPQHLACIAPWEGLDDAYEQLFYRGGIPEAGFSGMFRVVNRGNNLVEDFQANIQAHPMRDDYWKEKLPDLDKIEVPAYVTAGWSHFHLPGSIDGFNRIASPNKWLRIHREFEWPDQYAPENLADLKLFFDRYLKGHRNGWELTPRVRIDVMDRGDRDHATRRPELSFPLPDTNYRKLYVNAASSSLHDEVPERETELAYDAATGRMVMDYRFDRDTELSGYFKLRLWVEARGAEDMDLFVAVQKADATGTTVPTLVMGHPHVGAEGMLRVSHRALDPDRSTDVIPVQAHEEKLLLQPGEIVPVDIAIWPHSRFWRAGEKLRLVVSGHYVREAGWVEPLTWDTHVDGQHVIHAGGEYDSYLQVPEIPDPREVITGASITSAYAQPFLGE